MTKSKKIIAVVADCDKYESVNIVKDFGGHDRVAVMKAKI